MLELEKDGKVVKKGNKADCIKYLKENNVLGINFKEDIPLLILGHIVSASGYELFCR